MSRPPSPGGAKPDFSQKKGVHHVMWLIFTIYHAQNKKKLMKQIRVIGKNGHLWAILTFLAPGGARPDFFSKIRSCQFFTFIMPSLHAKNWDDLRKKNFNF